MPAAVSILLALLFSKICPFLTLILADLKTASSAISCIFSILHLAQESTPAPDECNIK